MFFNVICNLNIPAFFNAAGEAYPLEPNLEMGNNNRCGISLMQRETITDQLKYANCKESKVLKKREI